jgi:dGTPase
VGAGSPTKANFIVSNRLKLSNKRVRRSHVNPNPSASDLLNAFESDRGRVLNSAAVRRLQQKTQVFPLEKNSAVRSRLTHSLEVMQVGRFIVQSICNNAPPDINEHARALESLVEMACVLHDVGNPPFGHFGEHAINLWFTEHAKTLFLAQQAHTFTSHELCLFSDAEHFEGNAQAIRLVHSLMDLNLTYPLIASILKYTRCGTEPKPSKNQPFSYLQKKVGYYDSERTIVEEVQTSLGIKAGHRHPAAYIMEAADDISYCMADLEDAVEKEIMSVEQLTKALIEEFTGTLAEFIEDEDNNINKSNSCGESSSKPANNATIIQEFHSFLQSTSTSSPRYEDIPDKFKMAYLCDKALNAFKSEDIRKENAFFVTFRVAVVHPLVIHAKDRFLKNIDGVLAGSFNHALLEDKSVAHALSQTLKSVALKYAFCHKEVETLELQGYKIITSLLDSFSCLLKLSTNDFRAVCQQANTRLPIQSRLIKRIGKKHIATYLNTLKTSETVTSKTKESLKNDVSFEVREFYLRCRLIQDHISGMTDQFALDEYRTLNALN